MVAQQNNLKTTSIFAFKHITKMHIHSSSIKNTEGFISEIKVAARVEHQTNFCGGFDITRSRDAPATSEFQILSWSVSDHFHFCPQKTRKKRVCMNHVFFLPIRG
jgi:hypothetical protein